MDNSILQSLQTALANTTAPTVAAMNPMSSAIQFNPSDFNIPDLNSYLKSAYDQLSPYYTKILQQAQGDYDTAIQVLQNQKSLTDYQSQADSALSDYQLNQNTQAALQTLGVQFPQETQQLMDSLNKRGVATTQAQSGVTSGPLDVGKSGESGYEASSLSSDQQLRQEAVNRSAQQQQQNTALTLQQKQQNSAQALQTGTLAQQQQLRNTQQGAQQNLESGTLGLAQQSSQTAIQKQQLQQQAQQNQNMFGGGGGNSYVGQNMLASNLPSELNNASGVVTYNGTKYNVQNTGQGTRNISLA